MAEDAMQAAERKHLVVLPRVGPCMLHYQQTRQNVPTGTMVAKLLQGNQPLSDRM